MSSFGSYSLQLSRQRMEELRRQKEEARREQVRQEVTSLLASVQHAAGRFQHHLTQAFGQKAQRESADLAAKARSLLQSDPDRARNLARRSLAVAKRGLEEASRTAAAWNRGKAEAHEAFTMLRVSLDSLLQGASVVEATDPNVERAVQNLTLAETAMRREDFTAAKAAALKGQQEAAQAEQARQQQEEREAVRREIVRGLRQVLVEMGFAVEKPRKDSHKVVLVGCLPSGRTARFEILLDGQVKYDFDGYQHRECGKDRQAIRRRLEAICDAKLPEAVEYWKDEMPRQIGASQLDIPGSLNSRRHS